jgi:GrpB-like predicted nucleotidyltransferase (UPF0157 family)
VPRPADDPTFVLFGGPETDLIRIADYDEAWPDRFEAEKSKIATALGSIALQIEHVGSTSVRSLAAKPIVDIHVAVDDADDDAALRAALEEAGYVLRVVERQHRMFRTPERDVHIHVWSAGHSELRDCVLLRDWLRTNEDDRRRYEDVKRELAERKWNDMQEYADAKTSVIKEILGRAERWAASSGWRPLIGFRSDDQEPPLTNQ